MHIWSPLIFNQPLRFIIYDLISRRLLKRVFISKIIDINQDSDILLSNYPSLGLILRTFSHAQTSWKFLLSNFTFSTLVCTHFNFNFRYSPQFFNHQISYIYIPSILHQIEITPARQKRKRIKCYVFVLTMFRKCPDSIDTRSARNYLCVNTVGTVGRQKFADKDRSIDGSMNRTRKGTRRE